MARRVSVPVAKYTVKQEINPGNGIVFINLYHSIKYCLMFLLIVIRWLRQE